MASQKRPACCSCGESGSLSPAGQCDIAAEAFFGAMTYLQDKFKGKPKALEWLKLAQSTTLGSLLDTARSAEMHHNEESHSKSRLMKGIKGLSTRILFYGQIFDTLSQHHPEYLALVWGTMKFILMGFITYGTFVERFSRALVCVADILPIAEGNAALYQTEQMKGAITRLYVQVIIFLREAVEWYMAGTPRRILGSVLTPYEVKFQGIEAEMKRCAQLINDIAGMESNIELRAIETIVKDESNQSRVRFDKQMEMQGLLKDGQNRQSATLEVLLYENKGIKTLLGELLGDLNSIKLDIHGLQAFAHDAHFHDLLQAMEPRVVPEESLSLHTQRIIRRCSPWRSQETDMPRILAIIKQWITSVGYSSLSLRPQPGACDRVREMAIELINKLRQGQTPVIWYLSSTDSHGIHSACAHDVLCSLLFQCIKIAPSLVASDLSTFSIAKLQGPHSQDEYLRLLCRIVERMPPCFVVIEAEDVFRNTDQAPKLFDVLRKLGRFLSEGNVAVKLLIVWHPRNVNAYDVGQLSTQVVNIREEVIVRKGRQATSRPIFPKGFV